MINAGAEILGFDGTQAFNATDVRWDGIKVRAHYPDGQNVTDNPVAPGDFLIESNGAVWEVQQMTGATADVFTVNITRVNETTTETDGPSLGQVFRGALVTPNKGVVSPYWNSTLVALDVSRIAASVSAELNQRDNTADVDKPVSTAQSNALEGKHLREASLATLNAHVGESGEISVDMTGKTLRLHDGTVPGGYLVNKTLAATDNSAAIELDFTANTAYDINMVGNTTLTLANAQPDVLNEVLVRATGLSTNVMTWPVGLKWLKTDGNYVTSTAELGFTLGNSEWVVIWTYSNTNDVYAKVMR